MERRPVIAILTYGRDEGGRYHLPGEYVDAVRLAGGIPLLVPPDGAPPAELLRLVDGVVFTGGGDLDPALYGGAHHPEVYRVDPRRDAFELDLARQVLERRVPVLGICRGMQVLNVATGGDLWVHVPDAYGERVLHRAPGHVPIEHEVSVEEGSRLARILGVPRARVWSWHHQAVRTPGRGWRIVAWAPDGVPEAAERDDHPWAVAVQWHPEQSAAQDAVQLQLFRALVEAAASRQASWCVSGGASGNAP